MIEPIRFVKGSDTLVEGWGMPFFGPFKGPDGIGRDFDGEFFSPKTDFLLDWYKSERPTLYHHAHDPQVGTTRLGGVTDFEKRRDGMWVQSQLDIRSRWYEAVRELIGNDGLSFSSGAHPGGVQIAKNGEITRWPWIEMTLTPSPANPYAAIAALKSMDLPELPRDTDDQIADVPRRRIITGIKVVWSTAYVNDLPASAFADPSGRRYPHHSKGGSLDLPHLRNALSRCGQSATSCGPSVRRHLEAHARSAGVGD